MVLKPKVDDQEMRTKRDAKLVVAPVPRGKAFHNFLEFTNSFQREGLRHRGRKRGEDVRVRRLARHARLPRTLVALEGFTSQPATPVNWPP